MDDTRERRLLRRLRLKKVEFDDLSIERVAHGRGFSFRDKTGAVVRDAEARARIDSLVIPPAWREVRIANEPHAHIQAVGRDEAGRLQYIYHPDWDHVRAARKVERLRRLGHGLRRLRATIAEDLANSASDRRTMLAAAAALVDRAALRAGHEAYAGPEGGRGAATLLKRHVAVEGCDVKLVFPGKGGRTVEVCLTDAQLAGVLAELKAVRGARLFKLRNGGGSRSLTAEDLNEYLREASGEDITAKDFRTFRASAQALELLCTTERPASERARRRCLTAVARQVGEMLNNTPTVARSSYIHPEVLDRFEDGSLDPDLLRVKRRQGLDRAESALMRMLEEVESALEGKNGDKKNGARRSGAPSKSRQAA